VRFVCVGIERPGRGRELRRFGGGGAELRGRSGERQLWRRVCAARAIVSAAVCAGGNAGTNKSRAIVELRWRGWTELRWRGRGVCSPGALMVWFWFALFHAVAAGFLMAGSVAVRHEKPMWLAFALFVVGWWWLCGCSWSA